MAWREREARWTPSPLAVWSIFFFSSRRRHTRLQGDWSSDVCSSDLNFPVWSGAAVTAGDVAFYGTMDGYFKAVNARTGQPLWQFKVGSGIVGQPVVRSEERRVGKECRSRWSPYH